MEPTRIFYMDTDLAALARAWMKKAIANGWGPEDIYKALKAAARVQAAEARRRQLQADLDRLGSVQKVADEHGLSRQRVHQIIAGGKK